MAKRRKGGSRDGRRHADEKGRGQPFQQLSICERARLATVGIGVFDEERNEFFLVGSGVAVDSRGIVATAKHVLEGVDASVKREQATRPRVGGRIFIPRPARYKEDGGKRTIECDFTVLPLAGVSAHKSHDLAVVLITPPFEMATLPLDYRLDPREGDPVATCGFPYGVEFHEGKAILSSFLWGNVSAVVPHPVMPPDSRDHYLLQLPTNPGNSGGAVFDPHTGCIIGIASRRYSPRDIPTGLSIAEPIHLARVPIEGFQKRLESAPQLALAIAR